MATLSISDAARPATGDPGWPPRAHPGSSLHAGGVSTGRVCPGDSAAGARPADAAEAPPPPAAPPGTLLRRDQRERHRAAHSDPRGPAFAPARFPARRRLLPSGTAGAVQRPRSAERSEGSLDVRPVRTELTQVSQKERDNRDVI